MVRSVILMDPNQNISQHNQLVHAKKNRKLVAAPPLVPQLELPDNQKELKELQLLNNRAW